MALAPELLEFFSIRAVAGEQNPSEEVKAGMAVVPEEQHGLSDDARAFDGAPEAAVAGDLPVIAHHVELSGRDVKGCLPGG